jgi:hypothetical protein
MIIVLSVAVVFIGLNVGKEGHSTKQAETPQPLGDSSKRKRAVNEVVKMVEAMASATKGRKTVVSLNETT